MYTPGSIGSGFLLRSALSTAARPTASVSISATSIDADEPYPELSSPMMTAMALATVPRWYAPTPSELAM